MIRVIAMSKGLDRAQKEMLSTVASAITIKNKILISQKYSHWDTTLSPLNSIYF